MLERNPNDVPRPTWMDDEYFVQMLQSKYGKDAPLHIGDVKVCSATKPGDNYASTMYRVSVTFDLNGDTKEECLIIKALPSDPAAKNVAQTYGTFEVEINAYTDIVKQAEALLATTDNPVKISPYFYGAIRDPEPILCFEDLREAKYEMFKRFSQLNLDHTLQVLKKLAKMHACSAVLAEKNPDIRKAFSVGAITTIPERQIYTNFVKLAFRDLGSEVKEWPGYNAVADKLFFMSDNFTAMCEKECYTANLDDFCVLVHDDIWTNNIMTKYNKDEELEDVLLVDYQLCYWGSPAIDLNFLFYASVLEGVRRVHFKFLVQEYHKTLKQTLKDLGYSKPIPSLRDMHIELIKTSTTALLSCVCIAPLIMMDPSQQSSFGVMIEDSERGREFRLENFRNPPYKWFIQKLLKEFYGMGFLDS